jgi:hypothetical protein
MNTTAHYLVELDRPSDGWLALQGASSRARRAADALQQQGAGVRFLRAIYVPEDDTCFFLIESESAALVDEVGRRSRVSFRRVTEPVTETRGWRRAVRVPPAGDETLTAGASLGQSVDLRGVVTDPAGTPTRSAHALAAN